MPFTACMPGIGELIEGAVQHAPQRGRQSIDLILQAAAEVAGMSGRGAGESAEWMWELEAACTGFFYADFAHALLRR